jgi:hypothetical protein
MPETLLSETTIHLFGRVVTDLKLDTRAYGKGAVARAIKEVGKPTIARIYAFAFQNEYFDLASPALFVVDGPGVPVNQKLMDPTGLAGAPPQLNPDLMVWTPERHDMSIRLDIMAGSFDRILLDYELADEGLQDFVRGSNGIGVPSNLGGGNLTRRRPRRGRRWRADED